MIGQHGVRRPQQLDDAPSSITAIQVGDGTHQGEVVGDEEGGGLARRQSFRRSSTPARTETSSAETGSSSTTSAGRVAIARAMATRWRFGRRRSSAGRRAASSGGRPTCASSRAYCRRDVRRRDEVAQSRSGFEARMRARRRARLKRRASGRS